MFGNAKLLGGLAVVGFLGVSYVHDQYDKATNYDTVGARISSVEHLCYAKKKEGKTTSTSREADCDFVRMMVEHHPEYRGFKVYETVYLTFNYTSPVDGKVHKGKLSSGLDASNKSLKRNDVIKILASKIDADKVRSL